MEEQEPAAVSERHIHHVGGKPGEDSGEKHKLH